MQYVYPVKDAFSGFAALELEGMKALASGKLKEALECYDRVILADPCRETILRVVRQYKAAGLVKSQDCIDFYVLACHRESFDKGEDHYGSFQYVLDDMRKKHGKYIKAQQRLVVLQANVHKRDQPCGSQISPPPYDDTITEQTALLKKGKPAQ